MAGMSEGQQDYERLGAKRLRLVDCTAPGELFSEYEASVGTGQVHVWFERPEQGWSGAAA